MVQVSWFLVPESEIVLFHLIKQIDEIKMCFHIGKWWQTHRWCTLILKTETKNENFEIDQISLNRHWKLVLYLPICSQHSMFFHSRNLPPSSPLFKQFSALGSKGDILIELNLFNSVKSYFYLDSFTPNVLK